MSTMVSAVFLPAGVGVQPEPMLVTDYTDLQQAVGGLFDVVSTDMNTEGVSIVGYINDEGIMLGLEMNYLASNLFKRELYGNCVIVWGLNDEGVYDGDNHDVPGAVYEFLTKDLLVDTAQSYNLAALMAAACEFAIVKGEATEIEVRMISEAYYAATQDGTDVDPGMAKRMAEILAWFTNYLEEAGLAEFINEEGN